MYKFIQSNILIFTFQANVKKKYNYLIRYYYKIENISNITDFF